MANSALQADVDICCCSRAESVSCHSLSWLEGAQEMTGDRAVNELSSKQRLVGIGFSFFFLLQPNHLDTCLPRITFQRIQSSILHGCSLVPPSVTLPCSTSFLLHCTASIILPNQQRQCKATDLADMLTMVADQPEQQV